MLPEQPVNNRRKCREQSGGRERQTMKVRTKKAGVVFLSAALIMAAGIPAYASEGADTGTQESSMNLSMSKESDYTMTIPKTTTSIKFGTVDTVIGDLSVTGDIGTKQQVAVTVEKTDFTDVKDEGNTFPFALQYEGEDFEAAVWNWEQVRADTPTAYSLTVNIPGATWGDVVAGDYAATLTFHAELQNVE